MRVENDAREVVEALSANGHDVLCVFDLEKTTEPTWQGTELPSSGRAPSTPVTKKRKRAPQVKRTQ